MKTVICAIVAFLLALPAAAVEGDRDPVYEMAVRLWLDDNDRDALPMLADLSRSGNPAAQVLLGLVAKRRMSVWLAGLPRKERMALLRKPGGLSGKSWLTVAANQARPLPHALRDAEIPPFNFRKAVVLRDLGEPEAAARYLFAFSNRRFPTDDEARRNAADLRRTHPFAIDWIIANLFHLHPEVVIDVDGDPSDPAQWTVRALMLARALGHSKVKPHAPAIEPWMDLLSGRHHRVHPDEARRLGTIVARQPADAPELQVLRRYCDRHCLAHTELCLGAAPAILPGGYLGLWEFTSPSNNLINPVAYYGSERALSELRLALQVSLLRGQSRRSDIQTRAACLFE